MSPQAKPTASLLKRAVLAASLLLSVVLLGLIVSRGRNPAEPPQVPQEAEVEASEWVDTFPEEAPVPVFLTNHFHWSWLESTNYEEYVANLRAVGCPDRTIADIIHGELFEEGVARERALRLSEPFWAAGKRRREFDRKVRDGVADLENERQAILARLGIADRAHTISDQLYGPAVIRFLLGPVSEEKVAAVILLGARVDAREAELREKRFGVMADEDAEETARVGEECFRQIAALLSPAELTETAARSAALSFDGKMEMFADVLRLTPHEFREIAVLRSEGGRIFNFLDWSDGATGGEEANSRFTNSVAQFLGSQRFELFTRIQDPAFKPIYEFASSKNLGTSAASGLHDLQKLAAEQATQVRDDSDLSQPERDLRLLELETELQSGAVKILGQAAYREYLGQGGSWLTNAAGL